MAWKFRLLTVSITLTVLILGCSSSSAPEEEAAGEIAYAVPDGWVAETPSSGMRKGQYRLPRADGDSEDAEVAVFHFPGMGGSIQGNIDRWIGQFSSEDGSTVENAQTSEKTVNGSTVTLVDVSGTYGASMGGPMTSGKPKPGYRMLAAIIETGAGPWFFKLTGPQATVAKWESSFQSFTDSLKVN
jgi:hypothetical protein